MDKVNLKQFQIDVACHICGAKNTVVLCSCCGHLTHANANCGYCSYCGVALEKSADERASALDSIVLDFGHQPLVWAAGDVMEYIAALVREVRSRAEEMGLGDTRFTFEMTQEMWNGISNLYSIVTPVSESKDRAELTAKQIIVVDGVEYPVKLIEAHGNDIWFTPIVEYGRSLRQYLTGILQKVGIR